MPSKPAPASAALERLRAAKIRETEERTLRLQRENAHAARQLVAKDDVERLLVLISTQQKAILYQAMESELPVRLDGLPAGEIRSVLRTVADGICGRMVEIVDAFKWSGPPRLPDHTGDGPAKRKGRKS